MESKRHKKFKRLIRLVNFYPPFLFSGIKVIDHNEDFTSFRSRLKLTFYNRNLVGTAFGGSLYAMCDPFFMFILIINLGDSYIVWDKAASIDFKKPGKGTVFADFTIDPKRIEEIRQIVNEKGKGVFTFHTQVKDQSSQVIAKVEKQVYVRKK
ncbi:DUF4442 domain-containing protein [Pararhodonellum marinum]|uniref:DUF4442 domain-containing protein n=1 Tax=Pararhodonellum marinum TaxID=2755358 RepID=UPI00188FD402|nr:DUF4442 domain-containing protein [Pararhodonellum marinum]